MGKKKLTFDSAVLNLKIDHTYFLEAAQILWSRKTSTKLDIFKLLELMGQNITNMMALVENPDYMKFEEKTEHVSEVYKEFLLNIAFLIKFLLPLIEQLDASIDKNIEVVDE